MDRCNDSNSPFDNSVDNSSVADQPLICSHLCTEVCRYHPINAPIDGTECKYIDLYLEEGCEMK